MANTALKQNAPPTDRLSRANPGNLAPCGTARGIFVSMLERFRLDEIRAFWRELPLELEGKVFDEAETYRYLWEEQGLITIHYMERVTAGIQDFLYDRGMSHFDFFDEGHFRFKQGGMWSARDSLAWIRNLLPTLYREPDPKVTLLRLVCEWAMRACPGAMCELPYFHPGENRVEAIYSFAPDGNFRFRCPFFFSRSTIIGMRLFPKFLGLTAFEETTLLADCLHPHDILKGVPWELSGDVFLINGVRHGRLVAFSEWSRPLGLRFHGNPVPDRDVILIEADYHCPVRRIAVLAEGCVYDAPLFLARIAFPRTPKAELRRLSPDFLANILEALSLHDSPEWLSLQRKYQELLRLARKRLSFEYRRSSQIMVLDGNALIAGVPAMILVKILKGLMEGKRRFDFRAFKHDRSIFPDPKRSSFETRWNRLRKRLAEECPDIRIGKIGKGEFTASADTPFEYREQD